MAVTINIDSQIVVQTAAQWTADATVYSGQRLLVTSDATYTGTDQRKFKIANGVDTWSNLDYFPVGAGTVDGSGSANTLPYWVDADTLGFLSTATYPDLTEISYVKGVTSAIQAQINGKQASDQDLTDIAALTPSNDDVLQRKSGAWTNRTMTQLRADLGDYFSLSLDGGSSNPADSQSYYAGIGRTTVTATASNATFSLGFAATLVGAIVSAGNNTASGTTEDSTLQLRNATAATSTSIGTFKTDGSSNAAINTTFSGLSISVGASDLIAAQWDTPAWVTNPTSVLFTVTLIFKRV